MAAAREAGWSRDRLQGDEDIMHRWQRSADEVAVLRHQQRECERALDALSKVTSCFQQLVLSLGGSADCTFLREEMDETRALGHSVCSGLSRRLLRLLLDGDSAGSGPETKQVCERLCVLFLTALENFLSDLRKAAQLIGQFPLSQRNDRRSLVNTGCTDGVLGVAARAVSVQVPWLTLGEELSPDLTNHISGLEGLLSDMQLRAPIAFWSVEATQAAWTEGGEQDEKDDSLEELMQVEVVSSGGSTCCNTLCFRLNCVR